MDLTVKNDIPIRLLRASDMRLYAPPQLSTPRVMLELPESKSLRTVVDRLKLIGDRIKGEARVCAVRLEANGTVALRILTPSATIKTFFPNLATPPDFQAEEDAVVCVRVDSRKLAAGLAAYSLDHDSIVCCPHERRALLLYVTLRDGLGTISLYVPTVDDDDYEDDEHHPPE